MVSRYGTRGGLSSTSTPKRRRMRSHGDLDMHLAHARDDRLAGLLVAVHVDHGVLFGEAAQGGDDLVFVALALGVEAKLMSGAGNSMAGNATPAPSAHSVSPVTTSLSLAMAPMSPATSAVGGLGLFALVLEKLAEALLVAVAATVTWLSLLTVPWKTRNTLTWPLNGSASVLKTKAAAGLPGSTPARPRLAVGPERGRRHGGGRGRQGQHVEEPVDANAGAWPSRTATGKTCAVRTAAAKASRSSAVGDLLFHEVLLGELVVGLGDGLGELVARPPAASASRPGYRRP